MLHRTESTSEHEHDLRDAERGSIPEWVMLLVMGIGVVLALWAIVQPSLGQIVTDALSRLR